MCSLVLKVCKRLGGRGLRVALSTAKVGTIRLTLRLHAGTMAFATERPPRLSKKTPALAARLVVDAIPAPVHTALPDGNLETGPTRAFLKKFPKMPI